VSTKTAASLAPALERLDLLLERAVSAADLLFGATAAADPFRGLHVSRQDSERLLAYEPGFPILAAGGMGANGHLPAAEDVEPLADLGRRFGLNSFDLDVVLVALAPELDLRYERLYGYLQDDVTRRRPTIDLALNLLCPTAEDKLAGRERLGADQPLVGNRVVEVLAEPDRPTAPLLARTLKLDDQVVRLLFGGRELDARLAAFCELRTPAADAELPVAEEWLKPARRLVSEAVRDASGLRLILLGRKGWGQGETAEAIAGAAHVPFLHADMTLLRSLEAAARLAPVLCREGELLGALVFVEGLDTLAPEARHAVLRSFADSRAVAVLAAERPWEEGVDDAVALKLPVPGFGLRKRLWHSALAQAGHHPPADEVDLVASRFVLAPAQIGAAARTAARLAAAERRRRLRPADLFAAARAQASTELDIVATKAETPHEWGDLVLPANPLAQLHELHDRVANRHRVLDEWGFDRKLALGRGVAAIFAGPSGSGKTMAAGVIARELGLDLYRISVAAILSKWIGETEKNLERVFHAAENANAILFFDEADALFGKRSESVRDSTDRYANMEVSYLLQRMEEYDGLAILATNLIENLDEAFVRRLAFRIDFPQPDEAERRRIWELVWPGELPLGEDVELDALARGIPLTGGNIRNIALAAAFLAAADGTEVTMAHLRHAARREYEKLGKTVSEDELIPVAEA
jgi:AAA+ superfamily predicted ATPase